MKLGANYLCKIHKYRYKSVKHAIKHMKCDKGEV